MQLRSLVAVLWCRPAAVALIRPLAWELLYAAGAALKRQKNSQTKKSLLYHNEAQIFQTLLLLLGVFLSF